MKKTLIKFLSLVSFSTLLMSFSCGRWNDNGGSNVSCEVKNTVLQNVFEHGDGQWKSYYSDTLNNRIDFAPISSSTMYNPVKFFNNRLEESSYLGFVIDTGTTNYTNCGKTLRVRTNLSLGSEPSGYLDFDVLYLSKDSVRLETHITGVNFIRYFTMIK